MNTREDEAEKKRKRAEYQRDWKRKQSDEKKKLWNQQRTEQRKKQKEREEEERMTKVRAKAASASRNYRKNQRAGQIVLPSSPKSKARVIDEVIDSASPSTSQSLLDKGIKKSTERKAQSDIVRATSTYIKTNSAARKSLTNQLSTANRSAVSKELGISRNHFYYKSRKGENPRTRPLVVDQVLNFYKRDDIVTTYPNKTKNGKPLKVMKFTRKQTFLKFKIEHPDHSKIGQTTFNKLKPADIKLRKHSKYLQCLCDLCDNITMIREAIKASMIRHHLTVPTFMSDNMDLAKATVCDLHQLECIDRKCTSCSTQLIARDCEQWIKDDTHVPVSYMKWCRVTEQFREKQVTRMKKELLSGPRWQVLNELQRQLELYASHIYFGCSQQSSFQKCKKSIKNNEVVVVVDFAENYVCRQFAEAQSAYYSRQSVTIHPMVLIFSADSNVKRDSVVMVSPDLKHDASAVKYFVETLDSHISIFYPQITHLIFWSDGCSSQYKSRGPMYNISNSFNTNYKITWNFFGSHHGKSESDGESAVVKSYLDSVIRSEQLTLNDAEDVFQHLTRSARHITDTDSRRHFYLCRTAAIDHVRSISPSTLCPIPKVRQIHHVTGGNGVLHYSRQSCYCTQPCVHNRVMKKFVYPALSEVERLTQFMDEQEEEVDQIERVESDDEDALVQEEEDEDHVPGVGEMEAMRSVEVDEFIRNNPDLFDAEDDEGEKCDGDDDADIDWSAFDLPMDGF